MWSSGAEPQNLESGHQYRGMNYFLLMGEEKPLYLTFLQIKNNGFKLKKGAESDFVVFWKKFEYKTKSGEKIEIEETKTSALLRYYNVFNVKDIEIPEGHKLEKKIKAFEAKHKENQQIKQPELIISSYLKREGIRTKDSDRASYIPVIDSINMPILNSFKDSEAYYSTFFHEMAHSTGHEKRLKRDGILNFNGFGSHSYSKEELVAELSSAYLSGVCQLDTDGLIQNSAAYLNSWLGVLKDNLKSES